MWRLGENPGLKQGSFMYSREIENYKRRLFLTQRQKDILIGLMLGDGHLESWYNPNIANLKIEHSYKQKQYVDWLYREFKEWVRTPPKKRIRERWGKQYDKYYFNTLAHPDLGKFQKFFYRNRRKIVPIDLLESHLSPLGLAVWFMDDGSIKSKQCNGRFLNTQAFSRTEIKGLQRILKKRFSLESSTRRHRKGWQIYILGRCSEILHRLIKPYTIPSMRYKLPKFKVNRSPKM